MPFEEGTGSEFGQRLRNGADRSVRKLPEKATRAEANRVPGVCINADPLWKAPGDVFFEVFVTPKTRVLLAEMHLLPI
jgi:hypothetical protein